MNILVTNCFSRNALAVINSLGDTHTLYGAAPENTFSFLDGFLKHEKLTKILRHSSPKDAQRYGEEIIRIIRRYRIDVVVPTGTTETDILSQYKTEIESQTNAKILVETYSILKKLTDKHLLMQLAGELDISVPSTEYCQDVSTLQNLINANKISFPFIVKPTRSYASKGLYIFQNQNDFERFLQSDASKTYTAFIAQEYIEGEIYDACMLSQKGKVVYGLTQCRKMTWANTGSGIINITTKDKEPQHIASLLLNATRYSGISMFEFIRRKSDGKFFLIECNPKIWGTTDLTIQAGLDIVQDAIDLLVSNRAVKEKSYTVGLLYKWIFPECVSSMILKKPRGFKTFVSEYKKTIDNYNATACITNIRTNSFVSLILEVLNKA